MLLARTKAFVCADHIRIGRSAESKEDTFQPSGAHVAIGVRSRALRWQFVQHSFGEAEQELIEHATLNALPACKAVAATTLGVQ